MRGARSQQEEAGNAVLRASCFVAGTVLPAPRSPLPFVLGAERELGASRKRLGTQCFVLRASCFVLCASCLVLGAWCFVLRLLAPCTVLFAPRFASCLERGAGSQTAKHE